MPKVACTFYLQLYTASRGAHVARYGVWGAKRAVFGENSLAVVRHVACRREAFFK